MFYNYLTIAFRNLLKNGRITLINVMGLAIGIACCLLIMLYVVDEQGYDAHWKNGDRIYRMSLTRIYPDRQTGYAIIPPTYVHSVKQECPEIEAATRIANFANNGPVTFKAGDRFFQETAVLAADSTFFSVFDVRFLHGNPVKALIGENDAVLTASTAMRYFGKTDAVGQTLILPGVNDSRQLSITGVCEDLPENSHMAFNILLPTKGVQFLEGPNHISFAANTYFLLKENSTPRAVEGRFPDIVEKYASGEIQRNFGVSWEEYKKAGNGYKYYLTAVRDIHLNSRLDGELKPPGNAAMVRIFTIIAFFILLIACVNFMNLSTARSAERAREVGIRKSLGGERKQLVAQFLLEAFLVSTFSAVLAAALAAIMLPAFNHLADKQLSLGLFADWRAVPGLLLFAAATGLLAGAYPAGILSGFKPMEVLKGKFSKQKGGGALRNGLVVFQFAISIAMIVATIVVFRQLRYISEKELGFQKDHVITLNNAFFLGPKTESFRQELLGISGVQQVGGTSEAPGGPNYFGISFKKPEDKETVTGRGAIVDDYYVQALGMEVLQGRGFSKEFNDTLSVVLNERAAHDLHLGDQPIGQRLIMPGSFFDENQGDVAFTVVGILKNFHFQSLHENIVPLFFVHNRVARGANGVLAIRVQPDRFQDFLKEAEARWKTFVPDQPFQYHFLDDDLAKLYASEQKAQRIFGIFSMLAVFIACIGLFGLAAYTAQQRTKEIGIRKVLGASVAGITALLAKDFLKLVLIALLIASPVAWYLMREWLSDFAYRIDLQWWMFAAAGFAAVAVAFFTVSFQSIRAAMVNPVKSLRSE